MRANAARMFRCPLAESRFIDAFAALARQAYWDYIAYQVSDIADQFMSVSREVYQALAGTNPSARYPIDQIPRLMIKADENQTQYLRRYAVIRFIKSVRQRKVHEDATWAIQI